MDRSGRWGQLTRRDFLAGAAAASGVALVGQACASAVSPRRPDPQAWDLLRERVGSRFLTVESTTAACRDASSGAACRDVLSRLENPFYIQSQPGGTQTNGWMDAWEAEFGPYAVAAESAADIEACVDFAREEGVRLAVKGAGHDYKGRSNAADSLLVWTHRMRETTFHPSFRPDGAPATEQGVPAVSAAAGARWIDAYRVASANGRYVQGGGCTTVGVAGGFIQGGGYGSYSKRFGTGAGGVLEFEVVTADGQRRIANPWRHADLFWALRGGGGGTFGIVTRVTLLAHEMPRTLGLAKGTFRAGSDDAFRALLERLVAFYPDALNNASWGEQIAVRTDNALEIFMTFLDLDPAAARRVWAPLLDYAKSQDGVDAEMSFVTHPFAEHWSEAYWEKTDPSMIRRDTRPDAEPGTFWWATNQGEVAEYLYTYQSRWIPLSSFLGDAGPALANTLFEASRHETVRLQINKGLSGTPPEAQARDRATSIHPGVFDAAMIAIIALRKEHSFPGIPGHEPDLSAGRAAHRKATAAMDVLRAATPGAGTYGNESDYFEPDWKETYYGAPYARLLEVKKKYDPANLFRVHQGVGSDL